MGSFREYFAWIDSFFGVLPNSQEETHLANLILILTGAAIYFGISFLAEIDTYITKWRLGLKKEDKI